MSQEADDALLLSGEEPALVAAEAGAFAATLRDPEAAERYRRLGQAAEEGSVPATLLPALETLLEILLSTQRIRRQYGPDAEQGMQALFRRTPRGSALTRAAVDVNRGLAALTGQTLNELSVSATPSGHRLTLLTDRARVVLTVDRGGIRIDSLETG